ncbi:MAG: shikimate dehydrogenase family protein, partial [Candidatus Odinarchaeia archaeon]
SLKDKQFLILGAGGVARAISYFIVKNKGKLLILNRTVKNAEILIKDLKKASSHKIHCELLLSDQLTTAIKNVDLVINATSVGMYPNHHVSPLDSKFLRKDLIVFDTVYTPLKTMLLKEAEKIGCTIIEGYKMLVRQGALSFKLWTATEPPILEMEELVYNKLKSVEGH